MPVTQNLQSSIFSASTGQSATLTFAVPAGKYNRALNRFTVASTNASGSGFQLDGARYPRNIGFDYTVTSPNSSTSGTMTLPFGVDAIGGQNTPYSFTFGDAQNGVTLPNILLLPDDFYKDLVAGCTVTLTLSPGRCATEAGQAGYHLLKSVVTGSFGYLPTTADFGVGYKSPFVCTDKPSEQALHFSGTMEAVVFAEAGLNDGVGFIAMYPPYTFQWSDGSGETTAKGQVSGKISAKLESQQDTPYGTDASGNLAATSVATYDVTRDDPGINQYGYGNYSSDYPWTGTVTITDSDFVPNVWVLGIGDTPVRYCTMGATITVGPPSAAFAQDGKPAYTAQATGGFVEPVYFQWAPRYKNSSGQIEEGEYAFLDGSIVTEGDSQTIIFANFNPPPPYYGFGLVDVVCLVTDSDHFGPCSHVATAAPVLTYTPPKPPASSVTSVFLTQDAHRRPLAALASLAVPGSTSAGSAGTGALGYYSNYAGESFASSAIDADPSCTDINLLVDQKQNHFTAIYTKTVNSKSAIYSALGPIADSFKPDVAPAAVGALGGLYPIAAQHPTDREFTLLLMLSGGALVAAGSADFGRTWTGGGTVASGQDFSASGRAGLAWLGETAFALYASGKSLLCAQSVDRGETWTAPPEIPTAVATAGPYSGASLLGWQGTLYALAFSGSPATPVLLRTGGAAWTALTGLPNITPPSSVGVLPQSGQIRLGMSHHSPDDTQSWIAH